MLVMVRYTDLFEHRKPKKFVLILTQRRIALQAKRLKII